MVVNAPELITRVTKDSYKRRYKMRATGKDGMNVVVSVPRVILEREADRQGMTIKEYIQTHRAVAHYNGFDGIIYTLEEA